MYWLLLPRACALGYAGVSPLQDSSTSSQSIYFIILMRLPYTNVRESICEIVIAFPKVKTSAKSVQTTRVVCTNFSRSLYRLQLKFEDRYAQAQIYVRIPSKISTTYSLKRVRRTHKNKYAYLLKCLRVLTEMSARTY